MSALPLKADIAERGGDKDGVELPLINTMNEPHAAKALRHRRDTASGESAVRALQT